MNRRGQVSVEYVVVIGFSLLILIPAIISGIQTTQLNESRIAESQLEALGSLIIDTADELAYEGYPAKRTLRAYVPEGVTNISTTGRMIEFTVRSGPGERIVRMTSTYANLSWVAPTLGPGQRTLTLSATPTHVMIT